MALIGSRAIDLAEEAGGIALLSVKVLLALLPPRISGRDLLRHLYRMGVLSVPIVVLTAFFTGGIMVIQAGIFVKRFGAYGLLGWGAGYTVFREVGPILIGLMFSGRVGSNNAAELGTMTVTEQVDGLRALAIEPVRYLIVPRVLAMVIAMFCLIIIGDLVAVGGGMLFGKLLLGVEFSSFYHSLVDNLKPWDFLVGVIKAVFFGLAVAITSCHFGTSVKGGAVGVGRAVNDAVVAAALAILISDYLLTLVLR
ncbi:MAG: ABC transporter permease [Myxococcales bacterium]|nr:ABC transporter permease [Myxococcales bacterium]